MTDKGQQRISLIVKFIGRVEDRIKKTVNDILLTSDTSIGFWSEKQKELRTHYEDLRKIFTYQTYKIMPEEYKIQIKKEVARLKTLTIMRKKNFDYTAYQKELIHKRTVRSLLEEASALFSIGLERTEKIFIRLINQTQQTLIKEKQANQIVQEGFQETGNIKGAIDKLKKELKEKADGEIITIIDKNGKEINYNIEYYAKLVAINKIQESLNTATVNTALAVGSDLVQVDSHNTDCLECSEIEGKIYSITGADKDFPVMDFTLPLHPNCYHGISVVFREYLENQGIDKYIDYSNGKTETHPTKTKHIPMSQRKLV
jgi:hypothetical protein